MIRQSATPILLNGTGAVPLSPLPLGAGPDQISDAALQALIHDHPACLPISEVDPLYAGAVPLCTELNTPAGPIDNVLITPTGLPVLIECKLWRNPEARRHVIGQILDYAKELSRWTASDFQREVARRVGGTGNPIIARLNGYGHAIEELGFNDALTHNLRRGRFLLLIVGDGIREGVEAIAEYIQTHAGLHFSLGLVELPVWTMPGGARLIVPRILARTTLITREVVNLPAGMSMNDGEATEPESEERPRAENESARFALFKEVVDGLSLDDPDQPIPRVSPKGFLSLYLPAPSGSYWISVLEKRAKRQVGVRLTSNVNTVGEAAIGRVIRDWPAIVAELGSAAFLDRMSPTRVRIEEFLTVDPDASPAERERAITWLRERINAYVTTFRPRIRAAVSEITGETLWPWTPPSPTTTKTSSRRSCAAKSRRSACMRTSSRSPSTTSRRGRRRISS